MEINILDHITEEKITEIVQEELRDSIRRRLNSDAEIQRIIGNAAYYKAYDILDNSLPKDWEETVSGKISELVNKPSSYNIFRYNYLNNNPESTATRFIDAEVNKNKDRIIEMVNELIEDKLNKDSDNKDLFVERLIDSFYNTFTVKFEREN